jgi:hypothetical protein
MSGDRFDDLMAQLLDDELSAAETEELVELLRDHPDRQQGLQGHLEIAEMLLQSEDNLRSSSLFLAAVDSRISDDPLTTRFQSEPPQWNKIILGALATTAVVSIQCTYS